MITQILSGKRQANEISSYRLVRQMRDYAQVGKDLVWQRQIIFAAALVLAAYYYSVSLVVVLTGLIIVSETYDYFVFNRILKWKGQGRRSVRAFLYMLYFGTALSASIIVTYAIGIAYIQGPAMHFMPLFFLFAAALFAAMNNHHLMPVLVIRLAIYSAGFIFIPVRDIIVTGASVQSELWAQLFSSLFVLYFIIDCSRIYLNFYRNNLNQIDQLVEEARKSRIAFEAKSEFLSTMSHELRTPLTSIKGSVDLVSMGGLGELPDKAANVLGIARRNCNRLITLVNDILDLQKMEAGMLSFTREPIDIAVAVSDSIRLNLPFAQKYKVEIIQVNSVGTVFVNADPKRIEQVFTNILSNAVKFSPEGSQVTVSLEQNESAIRILFSDEGIGLDESEHKLVFDKFSQLDSSDTRKIGGTGLGMNISMKIVTAFGGSIGYWRNRSVGTTFYVDLPIASQISQTLSA